MRGATIKHLDIVFIYLISIHAPVRGATLILICSLCLFVYFNSRSRAGSDGYGSVIKLSGKNFNSRSRAGSDNISIFISPYFYSFQFTLPCGERRSHDWGYWNNSFISIHAPVRGATPSLYNDIENEIISIHAPVRGATNSTKLLSGFSPFQFTLPCGERQQLLSVKMKN